MRAASDLGLAGCALTDRDGVYGLPQAYRAAKEAGLPLLCGAVVTVLDRPPVVLLAEDRIGWGRLCRLLTDARAHRPKGHAGVDVERLLAAAGGLTCLLLDGWTPCEGRKLREAYGDSLEVVWSRRLDGADRARFDRARDLARALDRPLVASGDVLMHHPSRKALADVMAAVRRRTTVSGLGRARQPNGARYLLSPEEFADRFRACPEAVRRTVEVAERCGFRISELSYRYPREVVPSGQTPMSHLRALVRDCASERYPAGVPPEVQASIEHELAVIERMGVPSYFLTVHDVVRWARSQGILCQGRGSAANSAVCFCLGITSVDPARSQLLFERFLSPERGEPPDIDIDFEHERREEVLQYVYDRYGRDRAAMVNEIIVYRPRSAIRDAGRALGLSLDVVDRMAKACGHRSALAEDRLREALREDGIEPSAPEIRMTLRMADALCGHPRHVGIHSGGFVISDTPLVELVPVEPASMEARTVVQWDKYGLEVLGFVKVDFLSLGMLTAIRRAFDLIVTAGGPRWELHSVPAEDPAVYQMFSEADTVGVFQIESRAQQSMLPRLRPRCFYDLVIEVAIVRPGPIQGGMIHPYLARRRGEEPVTYAHPAMQPILERTLGVPLFQEQVMAMAMAVGGFTAGEADALRRAMGAWRKTGNLQGLGRDLVNRMVERGLDAAYADRILQQIKGFGEYGFPESHAASFALLVYVSGWIKRHHPAAFCGALLNSQPMGFYAPRSLIADAQRHGVEVRPVSVQHSGWDCSLERSSEHGPALRLGLRLVRGLSRQDAEALLRARESGGVFADLPDLATRTALGTAPLELLASAGALDALTSTRRQAHWEVQGLWSDAPLYAGLGRAEPSPPLPPSTRVECLIDDYRAVGLSLTDHPADLAREGLQAQGWGGPPLAAVVEAEPGQRIEVVGLISSRQRPPTARGVTFLSLEDMSGMLNVVVWPDVWQRYRRELLDVPVVRVRGRVEREGRSVSLVLERAWSVEAAASLTVPRRDFR